MIEVLMAERTPHQASSVSPMLRLAEVVASLSLATDVGTGQPLERALRTCLLAFRLGQALGLSDNQLHTVYYVALLRFVGCTADAVHMADIFGDELAAQAQVATVELLPLPMIMAMLRYAGEGYPLPQRLRKLSYGLSSGIERTREAEVAHCEVSQNIAQRLGLGEAVRDALGEIFERWDGRGVPGRARGEALSTAIRLVHIAQDAVIFYRVGGVDGAQNAARKRAGGFYDPQMAALFVRHATTLLAELDQVSIWETVLELEPSPRLFLSESQLDVAVRAIADFSDLRSPYARTHSSAVAELSFAAARRCGLCGADALLVQRAGYLHDLGRTTVPLTIWDKPGKLTPSEWERVRLYPYYTERLLARSPALASIGALAALHRERLDGSGYHRGLPGALLSPLVCLLAAADVYQSKIEPRAYRAAYTPEAARDELRTQVRLGKLDQQAVEAVLSCVGEVRRADRRVWPANLSEREVEVLRLIARGLSTRQIAQTLTISPKTADHHIQHIYNKIGVSTRAAATLFAMQHNLLREGFSE
ncbi:MAG: HD domain-containing protein [Chloroflexi bacterium]|nr:HD domain-containing protein [Chloroflexota bacterium]